jgi:hypothetical protein
MVGSFGRKPSTFPSGGDDLLQGFKMKRISRKKKGPDDRGRVYHREETPYIGSNPGLFLVVESFRTVELQRPRLTWAVMVAPFGRLNNASTLAADRTTGIGPGAAAEHVEGRGTRRRHRTARGALRRSRPPIRLPSLGDAWGGLPPL